MPLELQETKIFLLARKESCIGRESNPGLPRGRQEFYHSRRNAIPALFHVVTVIPCIQNIVLLHRLLCHRLN